MTQDSAEEHHYEHIKTTQDSTEGRHYEHVTVINYRKDKTINVKRLIVLLRDYEDLSEDGPANYIKELKAKLKISEEIGRAFEEDAGQSRAKLDKAISAMQALKDFDELPLSAKRPDVFERRVRHPILVALAEIKGE